MMILMGRRRVKKRRWGRKRRYKKRRWTWPVVTHCKLLLSMLLLTQHHHHRHWIQWRCKRTSFINIKVWHIIMAERWRCRGWDGTGMKRLSCRRNEGTIITHERRMRRGCHSHPHHLLCHHPVDKTTVVLSVTGHHGICCLSTFTAWRWLFLAVRRRACCWHHVLLFSSLFCFTSRTSMTYSITFDVSYCWNKRSSCVFS